METQNNTRFTPHLSLDQRRLAIQVEFLLRDFPEALEPLTKTVQLMRNEGEEKERRRMKSIKLFTAIAATNDRRSFKRAVRRYHTHRANAETLDARLVKRC